MLRIFLFLLVFVLPCTAMSQWRLEQSEDGHWINLYNPEKHQLIVAKSNSEIHIFLGINITQPSAGSHANALLSIDAGPALNVTLELIQKRRSELLFKILLSNKQKEKLIREMRAGLVFRIAFLNGKAKTETIDFSLLGFTAAWNDLLIANEIGMLDPQWLMAHNKNHELYCYYLAEISIQATKHRINGATYKQTLNYIQHTGISIVDESIPEIVEQVFDLPRTQLPIGARGNKYGIYKRCMEHLADD